MYFCPAKIHQNYRDFAHPCKASYPQLIRKAKFHCKFVEIKDMKKVILSFTIIFCLALSVILFYFLFSQPSVNQLPNNVANNSKPENFLNEKKKVKLVDFYSLSPNFLFSGHIPENMEAEYISSLRAINIYDLSSSGSGNIEKSQIPNFAG